MDPAALAAAAVGLLGPFLGRAGENLADTAGEKMGALYQAVKKRLSGDSYQEAVMHGAEERPGSPARIGALEGLLGETLAADPDFAALLADLVAAATAAGAIQATDSGAVAGGDISMRGTYVAGRDLHIGRAD